MGCGCTRGAVAQVHPEKPLSVVPSASGSTSRPLQEPDAPSAVVVLVESPSAVEAPSVATAALDPKCPQSLTAAQAEATPPPSRPKKTLIKAAKENNINLIDELLRSGASLEDVGMWDNTPLLVACTYGLSEAALRLISHKANVAAINEHGATPMHYAAVEGMLDVVEALLGVVRAEGIDGGTTKLVNCGHAKVYNRHLDAYANRSPLCSAAESGFADVAGVLLAAGALLEAADEDGRTALWLAARHGRLGVVRLLLQHAADTGVKDSKGISVIEAGTTSGNEEIVLALLGAGVSDVNDTSGSPLRDAVRSGKRGVVEALLTHGASIELKPGATGNPALHAACEKGDEYFVHLLVRARADPSLRNAAGQTAFDLLRRRGLPDGQIVQLLSPPAVVGGFDGSTGATGETAEVI